VVRFDEEDEVMPYSDDGTYWPDMRDGLANIGRCEQTPIMGSWNCAFNNDYLIKVIECLEKKAKFVEAGLDEYNEAERFAYHVLFANWEQRNGNFEKAKKIMEERYNDARTTD
jgi:hypothetical protein